jgi:cytochrome c
MLFGCKEVGVILVALFLMACAGTQTIPEPDSPGARLFKERCTKCHGLPGPKRHTPEQWDHLLVMMDGFKQEKGMQFPAQERKLLQDYLHRNGR